MQSRSINHNNIQYSLLPYPEGRDFAFTIVDDTDYAIGPDIKPVYDFLYVNNFKTTKTVWVFDAKRNNAFSEELEYMAPAVKWGSSLEDRAYLAFVKELESRGFEIALHGVSSGNDTRKEILAGYNRFRELFGYYPSMDILHAQNIENLYCGKHKLDSKILKYVESVLCKSDYQGHIEGSKYFWGDICKQHIKYVRLPFHEIDEINLLKINPSMPFHDSNRNYVNFWYPSSNGSNYARFIRLIRKDNIDRLVKEQGSAIIYTHFANGFTENMDASYRLKDDFKNKMSYIKSLNGWFATATQILDRLRAVKEIHVNVREDGLLIANIGENEVVSLTLFGPPDRKYIGLNDTAYQADREGKLLINKIEKKSLLFLRFYDTAKPMNKILLNERKCIEWVNYLGSIKNKIFKR